MTEKKPKLFDCRILSFYGDATPMETSRGHVRLDGGKLAVIYRCTTGEITWSGFDAGGGHWQMTASNGGRGTLHSADGREFHGPWVESGCDGHWTIILLD